ncbi:hypothetical protein DSECCO2_569750 [anaerobic digester metagenome]
MLLRQHVLGQVISRADIFGREQFEHAVAAKHPRAHPVDFGPDGIALPQGNPAAVFVAQDPRTEAMCNPFIPGRLHAAIRVLQAADRLIRGPMLELRLTPRRVDVHDGKGGGRKGGALEGLEHSDTGPQAQGGQGREQNLFGLDVAEEKTHQLEE